jgi:SNF2 family DNA or RNA helicase
MQAVLVNDEIKVTDCFLQKASIKEIPGHRWDAESKAWFVPANERNAATLQLIGAELDDGLRALAKQTADTDNGDEQPFCSMPIKATPYRHQVRAFNFVMNLLSNRKGAAVLADMGTGKSLMSVAIAGALLAEGKLKKLLVVCPKSIVGVWESEFAKFADYPYKLTALEGNSVKKAEQLKRLTGDGLLVAVVNYESCWRLESEIARWRPDMIVCDESSKIKNAQAKQSKALHRLGGASRFNMILTGTPITNNPLDFFSQYKFVDSDIFGGSFYSFRARYAVIGGYGNHQIIGYRNMPELVTKAHSIAFRVRLEDAVDLPPYIDQTRVIVLERKARAVYDDIEKESYAELFAGGEITTRNVLTRLLRLSQCTGGFIRPDDGETAIAVSTAKLEALEDILDECLEQDKKVVVFARFIPEIEAIEKLLRNKKIGYAVIHGGITDRAEQVERFQTDPSCRVFVGQLQTTGMGLTLTAASVAVYYSLDFSYANYQQSRARIHRIGQTKKTLYIHLVAKDTVDEKIISALQHKGDIATLLVDEWRKLKEVTPM